MNFFDSNNCDQPFHFFARSGEGEINAYHSDNAACQGAEFNLTDLLEDDLPQAVECPWCFKTVFDTEHMRECSGYKAAPTVSEINDAYSDPTDAAKRESLLRGRESQ